MMGNYTLRAFWDSEAGVWVAESDDVPGLITEAETMELLIVKLHGLIPELLVENGVLTAGVRREIPFFIHGQRLETLAYG